MEMEQNGLDIFVCIVFMGEAIESEYARSKRTIAQNV